MFVLLGARVGVSEMFCTWFSLVIIKGLTKPPHQDLVPWNSWYQITFCDFALEVRAYQHVDDAGLEDLWANLPQKDYVKNREIKCFKEAMAQCLVVRSFLERSTFLCCWRLSPCFPFWELLATWLRVIFRMTQTAKNTSRVIMRGIILSSLPSSLRSKAGKPLPLPKNCT